MDLLSQIEYRVDLVYTYNFGTTGEAIQYQAMKRFSLSSVSMASVDC